MATQPAFTPGPWVLDDVYIRCQEGELIADCDRFQYTDDGEVRLPDCEANARLISAAPELLEALDWLMAALRSGTVATTPGLYEKADAAIAKATGDA